MGKEGPCLVKTFPFRGPSRELRMDLDIFSAGYAYRQIGMGGQRGVCGLLCRVPRGESTRIQEKVM